VGRFLIKPELAAPNRANSLWRRCLHAYLAGWDRGFVSGGLQTAAREDGFRTAGTWQGTPLATDYAAIDAGRILRIVGTAGTRLNWPDTGNRFDISNSRMSIAIVVRPGEVPGVGVSSFIYSKAASFVDNGWIFFTALQGGNHKWYWHAAGAGGGPAAISTTIPSVGRTDVIVGTYDQVNLKIYVNGALEAVTANVAAVVNNNADVSISQTGDITTHIRCDVGMCAMWDRVLSDAEIARINSDPYSMWRPAHKDFMFGPGMVPASGYRQHLWLSM
jgi:hypothetical protein